MDFRDIKEFLKDALKYIIVVVVVLFIAIYVVGLQQVIGPSMKPTLEEGNVVIVDKIFYKFLGIKRNETIVFNNAGTKYLIKRVIGLPGETIEYKDNIIYINGEAYKETFNENIETEDFSLSDLGYDVIPEDMYLVLGDNRGDSMDSRDPSVGLVSKKAIIGKVILRIWPLNQIKFVK